ncbi:MAG: 50S ribosomal protein L30 [Acidibacillus sp.]|uniref:Large ribosomal subunit protein uL30 n=1 Tax=Sulfoacidibacillus ferrooxidans TaxID=2005001 RepID=A0A9X1VAN7_9BACL|nr:50S ribosomal protein L30 [Sulfoacidibacillus ferrooxidans]MCI0183830.1 50S ribosomal protein L30 [Sulfoacidibacillus ferrooxidans]MCY0893690.1 50S ribosomal protein L30 [Acidibacillus sp.]
MKQLQIKLVRSLIGRTQSQRDTVKSLGLRKINQVVLREDNASVRGMVSKVSHMIELTEIDA